MHIQSGISNRIPVLAYRKFQNRIGNLLISQTSLRIIVKQTDRKKEEEMSDIMDEISPVQCR